MALRLVFIERRQFLLKRVAKQGVAVLPQKHKQLGPTNASDDGLFSCREFDWWMPQGWAHV
jgi:hypothetical protein